MLSRRSDAEPDNLSGMRSRTAAKKITRIPIRRILLSQCLYKTTLLFSCLNIVYIDT